jgi:hypothetical protein
LIALVTVREFLSLGPVTIAAAAISCIARLAPERNRSTRRGTGAVIKSITEEKVEEEPEGNGADC